MLWSCAMQRQLMNGVNIAQVERTTEASCRQACSKHYWPRDRCTWHRVLPVDAMGDEGVGLPVLPLNDMRKVVPRCHLQQHKQSNGGKLWAAEESAALL